MSIFNATQPARAKIYAADLMMLLNFILVAKLV